MDCKITLTLEEVREYQNKMELWSREASKELIKYWIEALQNMPEGEYKEMNIAHIRAKAKASESAAISPIPKLLVEI